MAGPIVANRMKGLPINAFSYFSMLAAEHGAANLGQGFPSWETPKFVTEAGATSISSGLFNQYMRPAGDPAFSSCIADMYSEPLGKQLSPLDHITCFNGAQQGIYCALTAFCNEGDEIVVVEPVFDAYLKLASITGVSVKGVPLRPPAGRQQNPRQARDYTLDLDELNRAITPRTRMLILNTPQTFVGKVFDSAELEGIAEVVRQKSNDQLLVLTDEVYEFMCFSGSTHQRLAALPGMFDRTISLFSAGKTFSCTGWRCGYAIAPAHISGPLADAMAASGFCAPTPVVHAVKAAFTHANSSSSTYYADLAAMLEAKRDRLITALNETSLEAVSPDGGYFLLADCKAFVESSDFAARSDHDCRNINGGDRFRSEYLDWRLCEWLTQKVGVTAIPAGIAYTSASREEMRDECYIRFAFCKTDDEISLAGERLITHLPRSREGRK